MLLAVLTSRSRRRTTRAQIVASLAIALWAFRLSGFLLFRILKTGSDRRFDDMRGKVRPVPGLLGLSDALGVDRVAARDGSETRIKSRGTLRRGSASADIVGGSVGGASWSSRWRTCRSIVPVQQGAIKGEPVIRLFRWSRHPNYFGESRSVRHLTLCISPSAYGDVPIDTGAYAAQYASIVGPSF